MSNQKSLLLLGASGFIGGSVLRRLMTDDRFRVRSLIRDESQVRAFQEIGAAVELVGKDEDFNGAVKRLSAESDIVMNMVSADNMALARAMVDGLNERKNSGKEEPILIQTSGTGLLLGLEGEPFDDTKREDVLNRIPETAMHRDVDLYLMKNTAGLKLVIISPATINGVGDGPVNRITLQVPQCINAQVLAGKAAYLSTAEWDNVNIHDLVDLYTRIINNLIGSGPGSEVAPMYGDFEGFYFATTHVHTWDKYAQELAKVLVKYGYLNSDQVCELTPEEFVKFKIWSPDSWTRSRAVSNRAKLLGWAPHHPDVYQTIEEEFKYLLDNGKLPKKE